MRFTTDDGRSIEWKRGILTGDDGLISLVSNAVQEGIACSFNYWGERKASISYAFDAYVTIGSVIFNETGANPDIDEVPDNPDGYVEEGAFEQEEPITAAVSEFFAVT